MAIESYPGKCGAMGAAVGEEEGQLSSLPDDLLHSILLRVPLKHAVHTSTISRRWARLWLYALTASAVLDFTDRDFVCGQPLVRVVATVNRCIGLHHGTTRIDVFRVALLSPSDAFGWDVIGWVAAALGRGAMEVEVDLTMQGGVLDGATDGCAALELPGAMFRRGAGSGGGAKAGRLAM